MLTPLLPLRARLDLLDTVLDSVLGTESSDAFGEVELPDALGQGDDLHQVLAVGLGLRLKAGPGANPAAIRRLLALADRACLEGRLGLGQRARLAALPSELVLEARSRGLWRDTVPLWWEPDRADDRQAPRDCDHDAIACFESLGREVGWAPEQNPPAGFHTDWRLLPSERVARLADELESLPSDILGLEREGVGREGGIDDRRSDSVCYLDGREPELLTHAPNLAALVQWLLATVAERLGSLAGERAFPPERAMLARYPAPSVGYARHLDNSAGEHDNGRLATLVLYLNHPDSPCVGGEIALWDPDAPGEAEATSTTPARGGRAVLFDSRRVPHQVRPLGPGPARWALTLWFNRDRRQPPETRIPRPRIDEVLLALDGSRVAEGMPDDRVLVHRLEVRRPAAPTAVPVIPATERAPSRTTPSRTTPSRTTPSRLEAWRSTADGATAAEPSLAVVATVFGEGPALHRWCRHHFDLGVAHLLLVFDHPEDPTEAALARELENRWGPRLTIWSAEAVAERWNPETDRATAALRRAARRAGAADAVAARQTLNAGAALDAFRRGELGEPPGWLLHLDGDERLALLGRHRGGATLRDHLTAAGAAGLGRLRYLVHELLEPPRDDAPRRYKLNPSLARTLLGDRGWEHLVRHLTMAQGDPRPYFRAHTNGKSAVRVDLGRTAAGVHDWNLRDDCEAESAVVAGPVILHDHFTSRATFRRKYRAMAEAGFASDRLFPPSTAERSAVETLRRLEAEAADEAALDQALDAVYERLVVFTDQEVELLDAAGLLSEIP